MRTRDVVRFERHVATAVALGCILFLAQALLLRPDRRFERLDGHRLVIDFPPGALEGSQLEWSPREAGLRWRGGWAAFEPEHVGFEIPGLAFASLGAPVRFHYDREPPRAEVLVGESPGDGSVVSRRVDRAHPLRLETARLILDLHRSAHLRYFADSTVVSLSPDEPFGTTSAGRRYERR